MIPDPKMVANISNNNFKQKIVPIKSSMPEILEDTLEDMMKHVGNIATLIRIKKISIREAKLF